ncbi:MAG: phosphopantetheine-binding protein [Acidobacteriota bacterium]|nr:phosphopantetheine-binding protein [Acidobacteriota bacterium]
MNREQIAKRVNAVVAMEFELNEAKLHEKSTLYEELELDSLDSVDLFAALGREFELTIDRQQDEPRLREIRTLGQVYDFVSDKLRQ